MISIEGISFSYGKHEVLKDISCHIQGGQVVSVLGMNGSGKSTLLKTINKILHPHRGTVHLHGRDTGRMSREQLARSIGYMPQKSRAVDCTVFEAVLIGRKPHMTWHVSARDIQETSRIIELMGLGPYSDRNTTELSGGELQRVVIARALAQAPQVLLLDEPVNHLDIRSQLEVMSLIRDVTKRLGLVTITVMHDLNTALRFSDKFLMMADGLLFATGGREVVTAENIKEVYKLNVMVREMDGIAVVIPCHDQGSCCRDESPATSSSRKLRAVSPIH
ncbi:MAG: ABC transporter ATP-binding protein [Deltaproteobacteria bacterium]|nr:ABC transporter ATP-binding protein [Deltaproteobacteria bacterium]MBF0524823.1 ABC transporter ATP-binding protein [Deltaproteobacteria bacterium]